MIKIVKRMGREEWTLIIASMLLVFGQVYMDMRIPQYMSDITRLVQTEGSDVALIWAAGGKMLLCAVISMCISFAAGFVSARLGSTFSRNLRSKLFHAVEGFSLEEIDRFSTASLITRITNDVSMLQTTVAMSLRILIRAPMQLLTALAVCLFINARLTLILAVALPVLVASALALMKKVRPLFKIFQEKIDGLNASVQENLVSIRVVKAFVRADHEKEKFGKANRDLLHAGLNAVMRVIAMAPMMMLILNGAMLAVFWFGGRQVAVGGMLTGELYSFYLYISQVLFSTMMVGMVLLQTTRASACATRILEVLEAEPDIRDGDSLPAQLPESRGKVEFRNVSFRYKEGSGDDVLKDISFTVEPGQFVGLVGATGTGKSTLVNLIPRFYDVTGGSVLVDGLDVRHYPIRELRRRIGMVLQKNVLFTGTIRENLLWGDKDASEEEMIRAAKDAQAHDFIMSLPDGYDTMLDQGGVNVSGGQKQRLCIARALLKKPKIMILDDATSAVDTATDARIREALRTQMADTTKIIIAQRITSVMEADHILVLDEGKVMDFGTHDELMRRSEIYREVYTSQQKGVA